MTASPAADPRVAWPIALAAVAGALVLAVLAVSAVTAYSEPRLDSGPAVAPPAPVVPVDHSIVFDRATRLVSVAEFRFTAPPAPFHCQDPQVQTEVFRSFFACAAVVHPDDNPAGDDENASVGMAVLDRPLVEPGDLAVGVGKVERALQQRYPADAGITVKNRKLVKLTGVSPDDRSVLLTLDLHYRLGGRPARRDRMVIALVELEAGQQVAWFATRPDDAPKSMSELIDAAARTVSALQ